METKLPPDYYNKCELSLQVSDGSEPPTDGRKPFEHQKEAWKEMTKWFLQEDGKAGIVVVPTGGGKTWLASHWILKNWVSEGGRLLWLTHRKTLLRQAFINFAEACHLAHLSNPLGMIQISSDCYRWSNVRSDHQLVFSGILSAARDNNRGFVLEMLDDSRKGNRGGPGLFVVVDEAHHAAAKSYANLLTELKNLNVKLLGLTATPFRMTERDDARLQKVFENKVLYQVPMTTLIDNGILSKPKPATVSTRVDIEGQFTEEDYQHLARFGELGKSALESLADNTSRNKLIVRHYKANNYGKTIVFAVNINHAITLVQEFIKAEICAKGVHSGIDSSHCQEIMDEYRDNEEPQVIVNVEMLTEGYDAPKTETIFFVRPTRSEALLRQMIGRGMRGPLAGGTEIANLVTFVDTWSHYHPLDSMVVLAQHELEENPDEPQDKAKNQPEDDQTSELVFTEITEQLIIEAYQIILSRVNGQIESQYDCIPHSWYSWEDKNEEEMGFERRYVLVFDKQEEGFDDLEEKVIKTGKFPEVIDDDYIEFLLDRHFGDTPDPLPSVHDLLALINAYKDGLTVVRYTDERRTDIEPMKIAQSFIHVSQNELHKKLDEFYDGNKLCKAFYPFDSGREAFHEDISNAIKTIVDKQRNKQSSPVEITYVTPDPKNLRKWKDGHDGYKLIPGLWDDVCRYNFPQGPPQISDITYTKKDVKSYWGIFRYKDRKITISRTLNSPDIPRFVLEFLLYHEMLHGYFPPEVCHNKDFRQKERAFVPSEKAIKDAEERGMKTSGIASDFWRVQADRFLDSFRHKFKHPGDRKY